MSVTGPWGLDISSLTPQLWLALIPPATIIVWELARSTVIRIPSWLFKLFRSTVRFCKTKIWDRLWKLQMRRKHGDRIHAMVIRDHGEYRGLSELDQKLFMMFRGSDWFRLTDERLREQMAKTDALLERPRSKANQALTDPAVFTRGGEPLQCYNCAFFGVNLKRASEGYERDPLAGYCYRQLPAADSYPEGFCSHHSALQGYVMSKRGLYNIAPVE